MTDDLISRQAAIEAILHNQEVYSNNFGDDPMDKYTIAIIDNDAQTIAQLPSADRPQGEWIEHEHGFWTFVNDRGERDGWLPDYECNLCGSRTWRYATNYCPNCGARMKGADDGEEGDY